MSLSTSILKVSSYLYKTCAPGWLGFISRVLYNTLCWTLGEGDSACSVLGITYSIRIDGKHGLCLGQTRGVVNLAYPGLSAPFSQIQPTEKKFHVFIINFFLNFYLFMTQEHLTNFKWVQHPPPIFNKEQSHNLFYICFIINSHQYLIINSFYEIDK